MSYFMHTVQTWTAQGFQHVHKVLGWNLKAVNTAPFG